MDISILYRCGQKYYDKKLAEQKIGAGQLLFLILIYENEGISMQNLAAKGCFDKGTITKGVKKLEDLAFVRSEISKNDKRVRNLFTTDKAKEIISNVYMIRRGWWEHLTSTLGKQEEAAFADMLEKLCDNARKLDESDEDETIKIFGLQKLTLLDYPGKMASTVFTGGCNFRCPFCQNRDLVFLPENSAQLNDQEIFAFLEKRSHLLEGICISGGEPLLHPGLESFLKRIKKLGYQIKLDTNGCFPEKLMHLVNEQLIDHVAMDIKNTKKRYAETIGVTNFDISNIEKSVQYLLSNPVSYEFRTTVVKEFHNENDIEQIAKWIQGAQAYYLQKFVDSENVIMQGLHACDDTVMQQLLAIGKRYISNTQLRGL